MTPPPARSDRLRQLWVTACAVAGFVGVLFGIGVLGTRVEESSGGNLADDATLLAPHGPAFSIWTLIYLLLAAYVIHQWLPDQASADRHRRIGWLAGWSLLLNAGWLLVTQAGWIWASLVLILALLAVLVRILLLLHATPSASAAERIVVDVTFGLYLGWVLAATGANVGAALASSDLGPGRWTSVALILAVTVAGAVLLRRLDGRISIAVALTWGLFWIAWGRLFDEPADSAVGATAGVCALIILALVTAEQRSARSRHPLTL